VFNQKKLTLNSHHMKNFKIPVLAVIAFAVFLFTSCGKKILVTKTIDGADIVISVPAQPAGTFSYSQNSKFDMAAKLKDYGATMDDLKNVQLESVTLVIEDPNQPPVTWDIVDHLDVQLSSTVIPAKVVASLDVPKGLGSTATPVIAPNTELLDYAKGNDISYVFSGTLNSPLPHDITVRAKVKYTVKVELKP
jgi:hypothetical protein